MYIWDEGEGECGVECDVECGAECGGEEAVCIWTLQRMFPHKCATILTSQQVERGGGGGGGGLHSGGICL